MFSLDLTPPNSMSQFHSIDSVDNHLFLLKFRKIQASYSNAVQICNHTVKEISQPIDEMIG